MKKALIWLISTVFGGVILAFIGDINTWFMSRKFPIVVNMSNTKLDISWYILFAFLIVLLLVFIFWIGYIIDCIYPFFIIADLLSLKTKSPFLFYFTSKVALPIISLVRKILRKDQR